MMRIGLYMNDLGLHDTSREMALSGIKPLPQLEMARDHVSFCPFLLISIAFFKKNVLKDINSI